MSSLAAPKGIGVKPILVTGGAGFIGTNLADALAREGEHVLVFDALSRPGTDHNAQWLRARHPRRISIIRADIRDAAALTAATADSIAVFHFAAQVAVTTSLIDPSEDFGINVAATVGLLEAVRKLNRAVPFFFASTNKVYGDLADIGLERSGGSYLPCDRSLRAAGINEDRPLSFHTPYGCSKGAADQYVLDYARSYNLLAAVFRMSCIYGPRQMGTEDQGWVAHFLIRALAGEPIVIFGDGYQVRDVLFVDDAVAAYIAAWKRIERAKGSAFNLGGGPANTISLRTLIAFIEEQLGHRVETVYADWRPGDQRYYVSDRRRAECELGLAPPLPWRTGVARLHDWLVDERRSRPAAASLAADHPERVS
jgi:CDP-paratose 2-epimerase